MAIQRHQLSAGDLVKTPAGRVLQIADIFVPKNNKQQACKVPVQFRNLGRKIVIFDNGSMAPLKEIQSRYELSSSPLGQVSLF